MASGNLPCDTGSSALLCDNLEGWDEVGDGKEVHERGDICILAAGSC